MPSYSRSRSVAANPAGMQDGSAVVIPFNKIVHDGADYVNYAYWRLGRTSFGESPRLLVVPKKSAHRTGLRLISSTIIPA